MPLFQDIEITLREIYSSVSPIHQHHYFELLYITDGTGIHTINENHYQYKKGNLYLYHLNRSFKLQTGLTLKAYINRYKLNLIETRLRYSDLTITEIANEMGFTDESHLNKIFKNGYGQTATAYRKANLHH